MTLWVKPATATACVGVATIDSTNGWNPPMTSLKNQVLSTFPAHSTPLQIPRKNLMKLVQNRVSNSLWRGTGGDRDLKRWRKRETMPKTLYTLPPPEWLLHWDGAAMRAIVKVWLILIRRLILIKSALALGQALRTPTRRTSARFLDASDVFFKNRKVARQCPRTKSPLHLFLPCVFANA